MNFNASEISTHKKNTIDNVDDYEMDTNTHSLVAEFNFGYEENQ